MLLLKLFPSHSHGKTPLAQINLNQSLFAGIEILHHSISDAKKKQFRAHSFVLLMNVSKGGLQCSHSKNKRVFDLFWFFLNKRQILGILKHLMIPRKLMKFSITRDKTLKKSVSSLQILTLFF